MRLAKRTLDPSWSAAVALEKDALLVQFGGELDAEREAQGLTVAAVARRARLSKRGVVYSRNAQGDPRLSTLIAQAKSLGRRLVITSRPAK